VVRSRQVARSFSRGLKFTVGAVSALALLVVVLLAVDALARAISNDASRGWLHLLTILFLLVLVGGFGIGGALVLFEALTEWRRLPERRTVGALLEWLGGIVLSIFGAVTALAGGAVAVFVGIAAACAVVWAYFYGGAVLSGYLFDVSFGWGVLIALGFALLCFVVGGVIYFVREWRKPHEMSPELEQFIRSRTEG
jgi:MFS family permease